ncbi:MAG: amidohydrolase [Christensenellaceae bacterium]|nr:amidohydrolase [Christensenellaceae bacterium]
MQGPKNALKTLRAHRRALHRIPEMANHEFQTKDALLSALRALKPDLLRCYGGTGIKAVFFCGKEGAKTLGFRADMDALPVEEKTCLPFCSQNPGFMHACGHDGHMALLLTFLGFVSAKRLELPHNIAAIFQPGEENLLGARDMVRAGILEDPRVDEIYGLHVMPSYRAGTIGLSAGPVMAGNTSLDIRVIGKSAHGAAPHLGVDSILAASQVVLSLEARLTRLSAEEPSLLTFGQIAGGVVRNQLAGETTLRGTLRYFSLKRRDELHRVIAESSSAAAAVFGAKAEVLFDERQYPPVVNDAAVVSKALPLLPEGVLVPQPRQMIAEDFSCYLNERPGFFAFAGVGRGESDAPLHSDRFSFDEEALLPALDFYIRLAQNP